MIVLVHIGATWSRHFYEDENPVVFTLSGTPCEKFAFTDVSLGTSHCAFLSTSELPTLLF